MNVTDSNNIFIKCHESEYSFDSKSYIVLIENIIIGFISFLNIFYKLQMEDCDEGTFAHMHLKNINTFITIY